LLWRNVFDIQQLSQRSRFGEIQMTYEDIPAIVNGIEYSKKYNHIDLKSILLSETEAEEEMNRNDQNTTGVQTAENILESTEETDGSDLERKEKHLN